MRKLPTAILALVLIPLTQLSPGPSASLSPTTVASIERAQTRLDDVNTRRLRRQVTVGGIMAHERVFQRIANQNGGTRASGTPGYRMSARYVMRTLEDAGYRVRKQKFTFPFFRDVSEPELEQLSPTPTTYETATFEYSGAGEVTGPLIPTNDVEIPPRIASTSGCEPEDFEPAPTEDAIALIQRGTCTFQDKAANAQAAGYDAVIIFNEGQEGRTDLIGGTLERPFDIPVLDLTFADGAALYAATQQGEVIMRVLANTETDLAARTSNILATSRSGRPGKTLVVGAHLDSVYEGPGINDNGSGTAALMEIAEEMADLRAPLRQRVRFAFWGAEESGLRGSTHYVDTLSNRGLRRIFATLNFDMVGSPNYVRFVYDGDGSHSETSGPAGSGEIERVFKRYFAGRDMATAPTAFEDRSDYAPFIAVGIPAGGLFTGAEGIKTRRQAAVYGGRAGRAYDPCYHQACDTIENVNTKAISQMSDAAAHATLTLARSRTGILLDGSFRRADRASEPQHYRGHHLR